MKKLNHDKSLVNFYFSELGTGWAPAVLVTQDEYDFIKYSQLVLNDVQDYFIGGSAEPEVLGNFDQLPVDYPPDTPAYSTRQSGNICTNNKQKFMLLN